MTTRPTTEKTSLQLPDPPEPDPEDMTSFDHLTLNGSVHHLVQHFGNPETTIVTGERYVTREPGAPAAERMAPDLLIAFNADPEAYKDNNGYKEGRPTSLNPRRHFPLPWLDGCLPVGHNLLKEQADYGKPILVPSRQG